MIRIGTLRSFVEAFNKMTGTFIVFEGPEGGGKSSQLQRLAEELRSRNIPTVATREPGGTELGNQVRALLLDRSEYAIVPATEVLLLAAARAQHVHDVIAPALERGMVVLCDRYVDSTFAYQGGGRGLALGPLQRIQEYATGGLMPDLRLLLDIPVRAGLERRYAESASVNRIDLADDAFHDRVRTAYLQAASDDPQGWTIIDAEQSREAVATAILEACDSRFDLERRAPSTIDVERCAPSF